MKNNELFFRIAKKDDYQEVLSLMFLVGQEVYNFVFTTSKYQALDFLIYAFKKGKGFFGYKNQTIAMQGEQIVAMVTSYDRRLYKKLALETLIQIILFYGIIQTIFLFIKAKPLIKLFLAPGGNSLYLANIAVLPEYQNQGIGTLIIRDQLQKAKAQHRSSR